jgi:hypothetical protein
MVIQFLHEGGVPIGLPGDVGDFRDFLNILDLFATFFIKKKSREKNMGTTASFSRTIISQFKFGESWRV